MKLKKYFPSQTDKEEVFLLLRKHWMVYLPFLVIAAFMILPLVILILYWLSNPDIFSPNTGTIIIVLSSAYSLFVLSLLLFGFVDYYLDVGIVTNERIVDIEQNGFFKRKIAELSLDQVEDVAAKVNGVLPTLFHFGDVEIQTAGTRPNFLFDNIAHPYRISKIILDLHDAVNKRQKIDRHKIISDLKGMSGNVIDSDNSGLSVSMESGLDDMGLVRAVPKPVQTKILAGIAEDKAKAKTSNQVILQGEMQEGQAVDL